VRLTVDTEEDYRLASWIFENVDGPPSEFGLDEILRLQESSPEKFTLNQFVQQKPIDDSP
jgi:spore coat polysaccharide biosynthesis protein SpsF (cytidylyltransferase family)